MENSSITVLVIDDEPLQAELHTAFLDDAGYQTLIAHDGKQALDILSNESSKIGVILSDVSMPEMDGYELCQKVKDNDDLKAIPFIFVSSLVDIDEKLKGYSVGGDDYVSKPISTEELLEKVKHSAIMHEEATSNKQQLKESYQTAMQAMTYSSDLGKLLEFNTNVLSAKNFEELSQCLFEVLGALGLRSTLHVVTSKKNISFGDEGAISPLEENVIELARQKDRFWDFGARTIINYRDFSLLIKNMPIDNPERYGMLKDTLGSLCNMIESKITILLFDDANRHKADILETVRETLGMATDSFSKIQQENLKAIQNMTDQLDNAILSLGLTDHQENLIRDIAVNCYEKVDSIFDKGLKLNDEFKTLDKRLTKIFSG